MSLSSLKKIFQLSLCFSYKRKGSLNKHAFRVFSSLLVPASVNSLSFNSFCLHTIPFLTGFHSFLSIPDRMHSQVRTWTKNVDIFEKDFVIVPINERYGVSARLKGYGECDNKLGLNIFVTLQASFCCNNSNDNNNLYSHYSGTKEIDRDMQPWSEPTSLILDVRVMLKWHLSKQGIRWTVSCDRIAGSGLELVDVTCFLKLIAAQVLVFVWIAGSSQVNML